MYAEPPPGPPGDPAVALGPSYTVRPARAADLRLLAAVEDSGGALFEAAFGDLSGDPLLAPAPSGGERADRPGFLLVAGPVGDPGGFAHVEEPDGPGTAYLAQLSVRPELGRRGLGTALVRASLREAWLRGHRRLALTTYRDLAWNAPFYARLGFAEDPAPEEFVRRHREQEAALGLDRHGTRVAMVTHLTR